METRKWKLILELTVDGEVVGVVSGSAALLQLCAGCGRGSDGVRSKERVHVGFSILAREHDRINVLVHERRGNVGLGVRVGGWGKSAAGKGGAKEKRRHPVLSTNEYGKKE